jgi:hypothetical protein
VDAKLKWGPHINNTKAKAILQMAALTLITASTWGATFGGARTVYSAVVRLAISYSERIGLEWSGFDSSLHSTPDETIWSSRKQDAKQEEVRYIPGEVSAIKISELRTENQSRVQMRVTSCPAAYISSKLSSLLSPSYRVPSNKASSSISACSCAAAMSDSM